MAKEYIITIDDQDRDQAPDTPFALVAAAATTDGVYEGVELRGAPSIIGNDIPTMLRELADAWPTDEKEG